MNITLITHKSAAAEALVNAFLNNSVNLNRVIIIDKKPTQKKEVSLKNLIRRLLFFNPTIERFKWIESKCKKYAESTLDEYIKANNLHVINQKGIEYTFSDNVNSSIVEAELSNNTPDYCLVFGTGIIKENILKLAKKGFINVHTSLLPRYKGAMPEFWQCYNQEPGEVGITFHTVDKGVDTGEILKQIRAGNSSIMEPNYLRLLNTISTLENYPILMKKIIKEGIVGISQPNELSEQAYKFGDITYEKRLELYTEIYKTHKTLNFKKYFKL